jgi:hypothetical protein
MSAGWPRGVTNYRMQIDNGAGVYAVSPNISTDGYTLDISTGTVLRVSGLSCGITRNTRARLEYAPTTAFVYGTTGVTTFSNSPGEVIATHTAHGLSEGDVVKFTGGTMPTGLVASTAYYVKWISVNTFKLSATEGGAAITVSDNGSGTITGKIWKAVSFWLSVGDSTFTTGAALTDPVPLLISNTVTDIVIEPLSATSIRVGWNNYPFFSSGSIAGSFVNVRVLSSSGVLILASVDGLLNSLVVTGITGDGFFAGAEVRVQAYQSLDYAVDTLGHVAGSPLITILAGAPTDDLWDQGYGVLGDPDDVTPITGSTSIALDKGAPAGGSFNYVGSGSVASWAISDGPTGVTIADVGPTKRTGQLGGTPTESGIFYAKIHSVSTVGYTKTRDSVDALIAVSGGYCIAEYHVDPLKIDLQYSVRDNKVGSHFFNDRDVTFKRGDNVSLDVIWRSGPGAAGNLGGFIDPNLFTALTLTVRPKDEFDGEPYLQIDATPSSGTLVAVDLGSFNGVALTFTVTSDKIESAFDAVNKSMGSDTGSIALEGFAEITYTDASGNSHTSDSFPFFITQDIDR